MDFPSRQIVFLGRAVKLDARQHRQAGRRGLAFRAAERKSVAALADPCQITKSVHTDLLIEADDGRLEIVGPAGKVRDRAGRGQIGDHFVEGRPGVEVLVPPVGGREAVILRVEDRLRHGFVRLAARVASCQAAPQARSTKVAAIQVGLSLNMVFTPEK